jgi:hypothetical protein
MHEKICPFHIFIGSWKLDCEDRRPSNTQPGSQVSHREWFGCNHVLKKRKSNINPDRVQEIRKEERAHETRNLPYSQRFLLNSFRRYGRLPSSSSVDPGIRAQRLHAGLQRCVEEIGKRLPNLGHIIIPC